MSAPAPVRPRAAAVTRPALVMAGLLLVAANLRAAITCVGPVLDDVRRDLHLPSATAPVLISLPLLAFALVSPVAPALARRLGLERALGSALVLLAGGIVVRSLPGAVLLWVGTALLGVAIAAINVVLPALVKRDFPARIGQITGTYSAVQATFAALAAGTAVPLATLTSAGWRVSLGIWAGLALVALAVFAPQLGQRSIVAAEGDDIVPHAPAGPPLPSRSPWRSLLAWQVTVFMGLQSLTYYVLITWLPTIERDGGVGATAAGVHQLLLNGFGIIGSLTCSALIPRLRDQRLLATGAPLFIVAAVLGTLASPRLGAVWDSLAGVGGGASIVLALSFFGLRTRHHAQAAALSGMAQCVGYLLAAIGPIAVGALHDAADSWTLPLLLVLVVEGAVLGVGLLAARDRVID